MLLQVIIPYTSTFRSFISSLSLTRRSEGAAGASCGPPRTGRELSPNACDCAIVCFRCGGWDCGNSRRWLGATQGLEALRGNCGVGCLRARVRSWKRHMRYHAMTGARSCKRGVEYGWGLDCCGVATFCSVLLAEFPRVCEICRQVNWTGLEAWVKISARITLRRASLGAKWGGASIRPQTRCIHHPCQFLQTAG